MCILCLQEVLENKDIYAFSALDQQNKTIKKKENTSCTH